MLKGLYEAAAGMKARLAAQEIIASNLANAGTTAFQREIASIQAQRVSAGSADPRSGARSASGLVPEALRPFSVPDSREGALQHTGAETDLALDGPGYFVVQTARGTRLFRGGALRVNAGGNLATLDGDALLTTQGKPIPVGGKPWQVAPDGSVTAGGAALGRLQIVLPTGTIRREGASLLSAGGGKDAPRGSMRVLQGFLEHSDVEPVREMVDMISGVRAYETAERAVAAQDETLQQLLEILRSP